MRFCSFMVDFGFLTAAFRKVGLVDFLLDEFLNLQEAGIVMRSNEGDSHAVAVGTCSTSDAVHIVLRVAGRVVVDNHLDVIDVDASAHDVGGDEDVDVTVAEITHDGVAFLLREVAVHGSDAETFHAECTSQLTHLRLLGTEDDDAVHAASLVKRTMLYDATDDVVLHAVIADVGYLTNLLGRLRHGNLHLDRMVENVVRQLLNVIGHGGREHDGLTFRRQITGNLHDVVVEAHVKHAVCLVKDEEGNM